MWLYEQNYWEVVMIQLKKLSRRYLPYQVKQVTVSDNAFYTVLQE